MLLYIESLLYYVLLFITMTIMLPINRGPINVKHLNKHQQLYNWVLKLYSKKKCNDLIILVKLGPSMHLNSKLFFV